MRVGTRSILFGSRQFLLHPWFVVAAWWKLYGFPGNYRLWVAFFVHDLGYWGKSNMDGEEGERHIPWGASLMHKLFDGYSFCNRARSGIVPDFYGDIGGIGALSIRSIAAGAGLGHEDRLEEFHLIGNGSRQFFFKASIRSQEWKIFCLCHSRFWAQEHRQPVSRLCVADKLAICYTPWWLYIPMATASGEIWEYMERSRSGKYQSMRAASHGRKKWYLNVQSYLRKWVLAHKDSLDDKRTPRKLTGTEA